MRQRFKNRSSWRTFKEKENLPLCVLASLWERGTLHIKWWVIGLTARCTTSLLRSVLDIVCYKSIICMVGNFERAIGLHDRHQPKGASKRLLESTHKETRTHTESLINLCPDGNDPAETTEEGGRGGEGDRKRTQEGQRALARASTDG